MRNFNFKCECVLTNAKPANPANNAACKYLYQNFNFLKLFSIFLYSTAKARLTISPTFSLNLPFINSRNCSRINSRRTLS